MIELSPMVRRAQKAREADIEEYLVKRVKERGGSAEKFTSPNRANVPDRLVLWPRTLRVAEGVEIEEHARAMFVECKAPGRVPTAGQQRDHERRRAMGFVVEVIDTLEGVDQFIERYAP